MSINLNVKRGLNLNLEGKAEKEISQAPKSKTFAIIPDNFHSLLPKMLIKKEGTKLKAGEPLFFSKFSEETKVVSPVSGTLKEIERVMKDKEESDDFYRKEIKKLYF